MNGRHLCTHEPGTREMGTREMGTHEPGTHEPGTYDRVETMNTMRHIHKTVGLLLLAGTALAGCAQDLGEINRVQPNYDKKADLLGREFYLHSTVIETSFTAGQGFPGSKSATVRGVFEFQEKALYFYRTYEWMAGSEVYAQKSDADTPMKDKDGHVLKRAVLQDFMGIACTKDNAKDVCMKGAWCADAKNPKLYGEADFEGRCVTEGVRYVYRGAPVMAWPIDSHFDIKRTYSAATGEKTNVLEENTEDRKWYEREYARIAWGSQQLFSFEADVLAGPSYSQGGGVSTIYEGDNAPQGEQFESGWDDRYGSDAKQLYFTYVVRAVLEAPQMKLKGWWGDKIPICFFYPFFTGGVYDCASEELKIRYFFLQVPPLARDDPRRYVPYNQDDIEFEKFGYFRSERQTYDQEYSSTFSGAIRRAQRHRIWKTYVKKYEADGSWKGDFDYSKMEPEPIVYYLNEKHPRALVRSSVEIARAWSKPFEEVVAHHKGGCGSKQGKAEYEACLKANWPDHPMFILCENSDAAAAKAIGAGASYANGEVAEHTGTTWGKYCRKMGEVHKFGDIRWSTIHAVPEPIQVGLYGYGPAAADPLTGEILGGYAHAYVSAMKRGAEGALRTIEYTAGVKDYNDIERRTEQKFLMNAKRLRHYGQKGPSSTQEAQALVHGMFGKGVRERLTTKGLMRGDDASTWAAGRMARLRQNKSLDAKLVGGDDNYWVQAMMKDPRILQGKGKVPALGKDDLDHLSLANWAHIAGARKLQAYQRELAKKNIYLADFADDAILGLAREYGVKYDEAFCKAFATTETDTVFDWAEMASASAEDETGDCTEQGKFTTIELGRGKVCAKIGDKLRLVGCSSKTLMQALRIAVNDARGGSPFAQQNEFLPDPVYTDTNDEIVTATQQIARGVLGKLRPELKLELWQRIYKGTELHEVGHTLGLRHNFEASTDALNYFKDYWKLKLKPGTTDVRNPWQRDTTSQAEGNIREKMLASVMDYTAKFNGRFAGLGLYDSAAIKFGYGRMVEVFNTRPDLSKAPSAKLRPALDYLQEPSDESPGEQEVTHPGNVNIYKLNRRLHYSLLPKYLGGVDAMYDRRNIDFRDIKGDPCHTDADCKAGTCEKFGSASYCRVSTEVEVPYRFCSDEYNQYAATCSTWDEGADPLEIARNYLDNYENYWFFFGYARDSETFYPDNYSRRVLSYFMGARRQLEWFAVQYAHYMKNDWWTKKFGVPYNEDPSGGLSGALSTIVTTNTLAKVVARPAPGYYCYNSDRERYAPYDDRETGLTDCQIILESDGARRLYAGWDFSGYSQRPVSGGQIYDRLWAFSLLTDPTPSLYYFKVNMQEDFRRYLVSPYTLFPKPVLNLLAGVGTEKAEHYGWCVINRGGGATSDDVEPRTWVGNGKDPCATPCQDFAKVPADQQIGCRKYWMFPDARPTFPSSRFRMPLLGNLYGMAMTERGYDRSYMDISRIFIKGHHTQIDLPEDVTLCEFTDPLSGKQYVSPKTSDEVLNPGCINIEEANKALAAYNNISDLQKSYLFSEYQFRVSLLEVLRAMHETYDK